MVNNTFFRYYIGANKATGEETTHTGYSYKTSTSLIENVIAKKELTLSLFSEMGIDGDIVITSQTDKYTDKKGKRVSLSPFQMKLVTAFAQVVDTLLGKDGVKDYIRELPIKIEDRTTGERGHRGKAPHTSVRCVIDIPELTKLLYSTNRIGGKQTDKVREEIAALSELTHVYKFKDSRGGTLTVEAPLITLGKRIKYETKDGVVKLNKVEVSFDDVFVYEINDKYSLSPITLLQLWNDTGVQTELFTMLLFLLQLVRGNHITHSKAIVAARRKELKKEKKEPKEMEAELAELKRNALTYKESVASLLERIDTKKYKDKGKYLRWNVLIKDLKQATDALIKMGIITEYYETIGASGERVCNFVINDKWLINEANKIKKLLPHPDHEDGENQGDT